MDEIPTKIERLFHDQADFKKQIEKLQAAQQGVEIEELLSKAETKGAVKIIAGIAEDSGDGMKKLREMADRIKQKEPSSVIILGVKEPLENGGHKPFLIVAVGPKVTGVSAGDTIKASADRFGGKGGGKPDFAQAGGTNASGLQDTIATAKAFVVNKLS